MQLKTPVTIKDSNNNFTTITKLDPLIIDHQAKKIVLARLFPFPKPLILWQNHDYNEIGDYTQKQIEDRILLLLGEDLQKGLEALLDTETL